MNYLNNYDEIILDKYYNNKNITSLEITRLYKIINDPWNLLDTLNINTYISILNKLKKESIIFNTKNNVIDFGCGLGQLKKAISNNNNLCINKYLGIDKYLDNTDIFLSPLSSKYNILNKNQKCFYVDDIINSKDLFLYNKSSYSKNIKYNLNIFFINSIYYLFKNLPKEKRFKRFILFLLDLENTFQSNWSKTKINYILINSSGKDDFFDNLFKYLGFESKLKFYINAPNIDKRFICKYRVELFSS